MAGGWLAVFAVLAGIGFTFAADSKAPLETNPRWSEARKLLGEGKAAEAKALFEDLVKQYPDQADLQSFLGIAQLRLRNPDAAATALKRAIDIDPKHVDARTLLAWIELEIRNNIDGAIKEYAKVVELRPDSPEAYSNLAVAQKRKGELDRAIASLNRALELKPGLGAAVSNRGWIFVEQEKWPEARRDFEQALRIDPQDQGALQGLARVLEQERDYAGAQRILRQLLSSSPNFVHWLEWSRIGLIRFWWVLLTLAIAWALKGRLRKARTQANG